MSVDIQPPGNEKVAIGPIIVVAVEMLFDTEKGREGLLENTYTYGVGVGCTCGMTAKSNLDQLNQLDTVKMNYYS